MTTQKTYWGPKLLAFSKELGARALPSAERLRYQYLWAQCKAAQLGGGDDYD